MPIALTDLPLGPADSVPGAAVTASKAPGEVPAAEVVGIAMAAAHIVPLITTTMRAPAPVAVETKKCAIQITLLQ